MATVTKTRIKGLEYSFPSGGGGGSGLSYTISLDGHELKLRDSDGAEQRVTLPNDSYDDTSLAGRVSQLESWKNSIADGDGVAY